MAQSVLDLDVWKEIAIAKQILIKTATDALGLDPECSAADFKTALELGIKQITDAESKVSIANKENQKILDCSKEHMRIVAPHELVKIAEDFPTKKE